MSKSCEVSCVEPGRLSQQPRDADASRMSLELKQEQFTSQLLWFSEMKTFTFKQVNFSRQPWDTISCS